jgi:hypothetical protein
MQGVDQRAGASSAERQPCQIATWDAANKPHVSGVVHHPKHPEPARLMQSLTAGLLQ